MSVVSIANSVVNVACFLFVCFCLIFLIIVSISDVLIWLSNMFWRKIIRPTV